MEVKTLLIPCFLVILTMMFHHGSSDFEQDKKQCREQLVSLSSCIAFVSGDAKTPNPSCCNVLRRDADKSQLCLCILVRDRNEPGLGFKLNATLALSLVPICKARTNATVCPKLLHLAPNSTEAQVFEQFDNSTGVGSSTTSSGENLSSSGTISSVKGQGAINGILTWVLLSVSLATTFV